MHQHPGALEVAEEVQSQARAAVRTLDETRDICEHQRAPGIERSDSKIGVQRGERICGDLRMCAGHRGEQRRFACVGQPHEPDVGNELQLEVNAPALPRRAELSMARRLPGRRGKPRIAATAAAAGDHDDACTVTVEIGERRVAVTHHRARRHVQHEGVAVATAAPGAFTRASARRRETPPLAIRGQRRVRRVGDDEHITSPPAVATVGSSGRDVLFAAKADRTTTA